MGVASFTLALKGFEDATLEKADRIVRKIVLSSGSFLVLVSPHDTTRFRSNWNYAKEHPPVGWIESRDLSGVNTNVKITNQFGAANVTGAAFHTHYLANNVPYAKALEYGHSKQRPHPPGIVGLLELKFPEIVAQAIASEAPRK